jgi:hypothetical protein
MRRLSRPWGREGLTRPFGPADCLLTEADAAPLHEPHDVLLEGRGRVLLLHPYPRGASAEAPARAGFPVRPDAKQAARSEAEREGAAARTRMNEVLARVHELDEALDDPSRVWPRLRGAWDRAKDEANPRMSEIVQQARGLEKPLQSLEGRLRRVLRRAREAVPLDRAQEIDRASMLWLARRPGRTAVERAGAEQRILATVRRENFDTPENRVLRAYCAIAATVCRDWLRDHGHAKGGTRWARVNAHMRRCRTFDGALRDKSVGIAAPGAQPNYVLTQDPDYRAMHDAWIRLLQLKWREDDLWAWQAQVWTDFCGLAAVLALEALGESQLIAQSPIVWRDEAVHGRWFEQGNPLAIFWLRETGRIVEVHARPRQVGPRRAASRAQLFLTVSTPDAKEFPRHIAIWTPHAMERIAPDMAATEALATLEEIQRVQSDEVMRDGLILSPGHGLPRTAVADGARARVEAIGFDASGPSLAQGMDALGAFMRRDIWGAGT